MPTAVQNNKPPSTTRKRKEASSSGIHDDNESGSSKKKYKKRFCRVAECSNQVVNGGVCVRHGAKRYDYICSVAECTKQVQRRGLCVRHGAYSENNQDSDNHSSVATATTDNYRSSFPRGGGQQGMTMNHNFGAANSGFCQPTTQSGSLQRSNATPGNQQIEPTAAIGDNEATKRKEAARSTVNRDNNESGSSKKKRKKYFCSVAECTNQVVNGGVCIRHGAKVKRCNVVGCPNQVLNGGVCFSHGAKKYICSVDECTSQVRWRGLCGWHGAKLKQYRQQCQFQHPTHRCTTIATYDGFCYMHHHHRNNRGNESNQVKVGMNQQGNQQIESAADSDNEEGGRRLATLFKSTFEYWEGMKGRCSSTFSSFININRKK